MLEYTMDHEKYIILLLNFLMQEYFKTDTK